MLNNLLAQFKIRKEKHLKANRIKVVALDYKSDNVGHVAESVSANEFLGFKISNILEEHEIDELLQIESHLPIDTNWSSNARTWPNSIYEFLYLNNQTLEQKNGERNELNRILNKNLTFNFIDKMKTVLSSFNNGNPVIERTFRDNISSPFISFRYVDKGNEGFPVHCENRHITSCNEKNEHLGKGKIPLNCLSYFFVLQEAEGGGLMVYDINWEESIKYKWSPKKIKRIGKTKVDLKRGDLFFFSAGQIWHEILPGFDKSRVTAGAFLKTNMKNELEVWV